MLKIWLSISHEWRFKLTKIEKVALFFFFFEVACLVILLFKNKNITNRHGLLSLISDNRTSSLWVLLLHSSQEGISRDLYAWQSQKLVKEKIKKKNVSRKSGLFRETKMIFCERFFKSASFSGLSPPMWTTPQLQELQISNVLSFVGHIAKVSRVTVMGNLNVPHLRFCIKLMILASSFLLPENRAGKK